jgi:hypothetical protein
MSLKQALPRQFKDFFKEGVQKTVRFKIFLSKKQQNGLAKPGHSAARAWKFRERFGS